MHPNELAVRLIANFGKVLGLENLALQGGTQSCALEFDGNITVTFEYHEPTEQILLTAALDRLPESGAEAMLRMVMAGNLGEYLQGGISLGLDEGTQSLILMQGRGIHELDDATFEKMVETFISRAEEWQQRIQSGGHGNTAALPDRAFAPPPDGAHIFG